MHPGGSDLCRSVGPDEWEKGGHHATWIPDGKRISKNLSVHNDGMIIGTVDANGKILTGLPPRILGSGHPTLHPNGHKLLTDCYSFEEMAYGDGTIPLGWVDLRTGFEDDILRVNTLQPTGNIALREDPHPAWDREYTVCCECVP